MNERRDRRPSGEVTGIRILKPVPPARPEEVAEACALPADACPRRYCWWWGTLAFDWDRSVAEGCGFLSANKPAWKSPTDLPCRRDDPSSPVDHYEPRDSAIVEDEIEGKAAEWLAALEAHREKAGEGR